MSHIARTVERKFMKSAVVDVRSGDSVRVHQKIKEGGKERVQIFEGLVIRVSRKASLTSSFTVRRIASGVGVEKTFLIHSPNILKIEVVKRSKVRRNYLSYMRQLTGKGARLSGIEFDREAVNAVVDEAAEAEEAKLADESEARHEEASAEKAKAEAEEEAKAQEALAAREQTDKEQTPTKSEDTKDKAKPEPDSSKSKP